MSYESAILDAVALCLDAPRDHDGRFVDAEGLHTEVDGLLCAEAGDEPEGEDGYEVVAFTEADAPQTRTPGIPFPGPGGKRWFVINDKGRVVPARDPSKVAPEKKPRTKKPDAGTSGTSSPDEPQPAGKPKPPPKPEKFTPETAKAHIDAFRQKATVTGADLAELAGALSSLLEGGLTLDHLKTLQREVGGKVTGKKAELASSLAQRALQAVQSGEASKPTSAVDAALQALQAAKEGKGDPKAILVSLGKLKAADVKAVAMRATGAKVPTKASAIKALGEMLAAVGGTLGEEKPEPTKEPEPADEIDLSKLPNLDNPDEMGSKETPTGKPGDAMADHPFNGMTPAKMRENLTWMGDAKAKDTNPLRYNAQSSPEISNAVMLSLHPESKRLDGGMRPLSIRDAYAKAKATSPNLTIRQFQDALFRLQQERRIRLDAATMAISTFKDEDLPFFMPLDRDRKGYIDKGDRFDDPVESKKEPPAGNPTTPDVSTGASQQSHAPNDDAIDLGTDDDDALDLGFDLDDDEPAVHPRQPTPGEILPAVKLTKAQKGTLDRLALTAARVARLYAQKLATKDPVERSALAEQMAESRGHAASDFKHLNKWLGTEKLFSALAAESPDEAAAGVWDFVKSEHLTGYSYDHDVHDRASLGHALASRVRHSRFMEAEAPADGNVNDWAIKHLPELAPLQKKLDIGDEKTREVREMLFATSMMPAGVMNRLGKNRNFRTAYFSQRKVSQHNNLAHLAAASMAQYGYKETFDEMSAGLYSRTEGVAVSRAGNTSMAHELGHALGHAENHDNDPVLRDAHIRLFGKLRPHAQTGQPGDHLGGQELLAFSVEDYACRGEKKAREMYDDEYIDWLKAKVLS